VVEEPVGDVPDFWNPQVLFNDEQYPTLPYTRYEATTLLDWGPARSLATETDVWVRPAGGAPP